MKQIELERKRASWYLDEIKENDWDLSINRYKEIVYEEVEYDNPEDIISQIQDLDAERKLIKHT